MSMRKTLEFVRTLPEGPVSRDDLIRALLRLDTYTMEAAAFYKVEPEQVTPDQRERAKRALHAGRYMGPGPT